MEYILEASTHNHTLIAEKIDVWTENNAEVVVKIIGPGKLIHGEHGLIIIESNRFKKYVQQEINPITNRYENSFD